MSHDTSLTASLAKLGGEYRTVDLDGEVHYIDFGGEGTPFVLVHGLGGMALNFMPLAPLLREQGHHVYAVDLAGFGLTRAIERSATVRNNAKLVRQFLETVAGEPALIAGNSMGGLICAMAASAHPELVRAVVLLNPAMPAPRRHPVRQLSSLRTLFTPTAHGLIERARKRPATPEAEIDRAMRVCFSDYSRRDQEVFEAHVDMAKLRRRYPELMSALGMAARSMFHETVSHGAVLARYRAIQAPVLLIHGADDRLVPVEAARWAKRANPRWRYEEWDDTGHVPMLEHPERTAKTIADWVDSQVSHAA